MDPSAEERTLTYILVVDDDLAIRETLRDALTDDGHAVDTAADALEALAAARERPPQLVLLDLMMPVADGWAFLRERREDPALERIPVLVLSAAREDRLHEAKSLGAEAFLAKPFDLDVLLAMVARLVDEGAPSTAG